MNFLCHLELKFEYNLGAKMSTDYIECYYSIISTHIDRSRMKILCFLFLNCSYISLPPSLPPIPFPHYNNKNG